MNVFHYIRVEDGKQDDWVIYHNFKLFETVYTKGCACRCEVIILFFENIYLKLFNNDCVIIIYLNNLWNKILLNT